MDISLPCEPSEPSEFSCEPSEPSEFSCEPSEFSCEPSLPSEPSEFSCEPSEPSEFSSEPSEPYESLLFLSDLSNLFFSSIANFNNSRETWIVSSNVWVFSNLSTNINSASVKGTSSV